MFRNKKLAAIVTVLTIAAAFFTGSSIYATDNEWAGTWEGTGTGHIHVGLYTIEVFAYWKMNVDCDGIVFDDPEAGYPTYWEDEVNNAWGGFYGTINDETDHGSGTWDIDYPISTCTGTWEAYFSYEGDDAVMEGSWYYYNQLGQRIYGGTISATRTSSGCPE